MRPRKIVGNGARHTGRAEAGGELMRARFRLALELAHNNLPVTDVLDDSGSDAVQAHEAQSAHDLLDREQARQLFLIAQTVLQSQHRCAGSNEGRQQFRKRLAGGGLEPDQYQVSGTDFFRAPGTMRPDLEIAFGAADQYALTPNGVVIR